MNEIEAFIRDYAAQIGMDPDVAVRAARSEGGLTDPFQQSLAMKNGIREPSYGPFQLLIGGPGTGFGEGVGNRALAAGIDPRKDWQAATRFGMDYANQRGWGEWYGPRKAGIGRFEGIAGRAQPKQYALTPPDPYADLPDGPKGQEEYKRPAPPLPPPYDVADRPIADPQTEAKNPLTALFKPKVEEKQKPTLAKALGAGISQLGSAGGGGGGYQPTARPAAARIDAEAPIAPFDAQQVETQRQMLALAMQRLNSGRLF